MIFSVGPEFYGPLEQQPNSRNWLLNFAGLMSDNGANELAFQEFLIAERKALLLLLDPDLSDEEATKQALLLQVNRGG